MKRILGIVLIIIGVAFAVMAFTKHDDEKTLVDIGKIEIKQQDKKPSSNTTMYYVIAAVCVLAGGALTAGKRAAV